MNAWFGALLGGLFAAGIGVAVLGAPPRRMPTLTDRIAPYVAAPAGTPRPGTARESSSWPAVRAALHAASRRLDRLVGGAESVGRRLGGLGSGLGVEEFRLEQVIWGAVGLIGGGIGLGVLTLLHGGLDPVLAVGGSLIGGVAGVLGRDWWLTRQLRRREQAMLAEFPIIADLMALSVVAGESPVDALQRVCRLIRGELSLDLSRALAETRSGMPINQALTELAERSTLEPFSRFVKGFVVAIERGTPLAGVLRAQATDVRESAKRALLETGGQKELQMMLPVVFLILPVTVLFALYPGLLTLVSLAR